MSVGTPTFTKKTYGAQLYKWSPLPYDKNTKNKRNEGNQRPFYCTAVPNSQGQDWITTYCYNLVVVNSQQEHLAYVACDYVE